MKRGQRQPLNGALFLIKQALWPFERQLQGHTTNTVPQGSKLRKTFTWDLRLCSFYLEMTI